MSYTIRTIIAIALAIALGLLLFRAIGGCGGAQARSPNQVDAQLYAALDAIGASVDPASQLAASACKMREEAEVTAVKAGESNTSKAEQNLKVIRERCDALRAIFDQIRTTQGEAFEAVRAGATTKAQALLEQLQGLWRSAGALVGGAS